MVDAYFSETIDKMKESFLLVAAQGGNTQDCESLIEFGADVNWKNPDGDTPLLAATRRGHTDTMALLLAHGADSNICGADSFTPLHIATRRGDASSVELLLNANTDRSARTRDGQTALDIARAKGYENIYARLMEKRTGITRTAAATQQADAASALINNVRNELPALQISRTPAGNSSIVGELRQLRNFDRLVNVAGADDGAAVGIPAGTVVPSSSSRRQRQGSGGLVSASLDLSNAEQQGREVQRKSESERRPVDTARALGGNLHGSTNSVAAAESSSKIESSRSRNTAAPSSHSTSRGAEASADGHTASRVAQAAHGADARAGYAIMGASNDSRGSGGGNVRGVAPGDETAVIALRKILDQEIATRKTLEIKLAVFKDQNTQLLEEFALLSQQLSSAQESYNELEAQMARLLGEPGALETATIEECEELEGQLKGALQRIDAKKTALIRSRIGNQNEQRMCVVCQDNEKSVVLLPCRHMCVCAPCSEHAQLKNCPLCREAIAHKISVFA